MRTQPAFLLPAALVMLLAASSVGAATPKACDLLSAQTATSLLGTAVGAAVEGKAGATCTYTSKSGDATVAMGVGDFSGGDGKQTVIALQVMASQEKGATSKSLPGLGDQSFLVSRASNKNALVLDYHEKMVMLSVQKPMTGDLEKAMIQTVRQVLSKL